jgi:hypothetical protein
MTVRSARGKAASACVKADSVPARAGSAPGRHAPSIRKQSDRPLATWIHRTAPRLKAIYAERIEQSRQRKRWRDFVVMQPRWESPASPT